VEICGVANQTKAVFDATASTFDADRSRLIPGRDTFYRWAIDLILEGARSEKIAALQWRTSWTGSAQPVLRMQAAGIKENRFAVFAGARV
jgi:hypothetical protein